jgi:hypothetical protein
MSSRFVPCPACARHVKQGDSTCPFCGASAPVASPPLAAPTATGRLSRSALFAARAAGVALAAAGCSSSSPAPEPSPQPLYGAVMVPEDAASSSSSGGSMGSTDASSTTPSDAAGPSQYEGGSAQPLYGAVAIPPDGGESERDGGSVMALYGGSPVGRT